MKTFILKWNPAFSSFTKKNFEDLAEWGVGSLNWSIWDYREVEVGDRFFMVRVGQGNTGIVMSGYIKSKPYEAEDWSGKGRQTFYSDLDVEAMVDSDYEEYISTEQLEKELPGFEWARGHSGVLLHPELAAKLEVLWDKFCEDNF